MNPTELCTVMNCFVTCRLYPIKRHKTQLPVAGQLSPLKVFIHPSFWQIISDSIRRRILSQISCDNRPNYTQLYHGFYLLSDSSLCFWCTFFSINCHFCSFSWSIENTQTFHFYYAFFKNSIHIYLIPLLINWNKFAWLNKNLYITNFIKTS